MPQDACDELLRRAYVLRVHEYHVGMLALPALELLGPPAHGRDDHDRGLAGQTIEHGGVRDQKVDPGGHESVQDLLVELVLSACGHSLGGLEDHHRSVYDRAVKGILNGVDPAAEMVRERPVGHLEEEARRSVVLAQSSRGVEEPVGDQHGGPHDEQRLCNDLGVLKCRAPTDAVVALAERRLAAVRLRDRIAGTGVLADAPPEYIGAVSRLDVSGVAAGDVQEPKLRERHDRLLTAVPQSVPTAALAHGLLKRLREEVETQLCEVRPERHVVGVTLFLQHVQPRLEGAAVALPVGIRETSRPDGEGLVGKDRREVLSQRVTEGLPVAVVSLAEKELNRPRIEHVHEAAPVLVVFHDLLNGHVEPGRGVRDRQGRFKLCGLDDLAGPGLEEPLPTVGGEAHRLVVGTAREEHAQAVEDALLARPVRLPVAKRYERGVQHVPCRKNQLGDRTLRTVGGRPVPAFAPGGPQRQVVVFLHDASRLEVRIPLCDASTGHSAGVRELVVEMRDHAVPPGFPARMVDECEEARREIRTPMPWRGWMKKPRIPCSAMRSTWRVIPASSMGPFQNQKGWNPRKRVERPDPAIIARPSSACAPAPLIARER